MAAPLYDARVAALDAAGDTGMHAPEVVAATVDFLADLADEGPALEFGIGTGRVAVPLQDRGVAVSGIDLSPHMVAKLHERPGGEDIQVIIGDIATARTEGAFTLVYAIWNTFINLLTLQEQVRCFQNAANHLRPGGYFLIDTMSPLPHLQRLPPGETVRAFAIGSDRFGFDEYDVLNQRLTSHHYWTEDGRWERWSTPCRYVWPTELDLMAQIAGLTFHGRWAYWNRERFTAASSTHISVWQEPNDFNS